MLLIIIHLSCNIIVITDDIGDMRYDISESSYSGNAHLSWRL